jgi:hypothetical protein
MMSWSFNIPVDDRYDAAEDDDMAAVGSIYVRKFALQGARPETIKVTLSWA